MKQRYRRPFNFTKVRKACQPKWKRVGPMRYRLKTKNVDPAYSRQGTRAKGKIYEEATQKEKEAQKTGRGEIGRRFGASVEDEVNS